MRRRRSRASPPTPSPLNPPKGEIHERAAISSIGEKIREFVAKLTLLVIRPTMAKHNQSPPLGNLGG